MGVLQTWRQALASAPAGESKVNALVRAVTADIEAGRLAELQRLPSQRQSAQALGLSGQTVTSAYQELERLGLIHCEVGRGSYVARRVAERITSYILDTSESQTVDLSTVRILHTRQHDRAWRDTCRQLSDECQQPWLAACRPIAGLLAHRETACDWIGKHGLPVVPEQLILTNGTTQALYIALASVAGRGGIVACDSVTDYTLISDMQTIGFTLRGLESDQYGIRPDDFNDLCANERASGQVTALVCTPNLNNPTVSLMPESRRRAIADIARRYGVTVIENDIYGPLVGAGQYTPLSAYLPEQAFYCTSLTKSVMTGLRVGMLAAPKKLAARAERVLRANSWMTSPILVEVAMRWLHNGQADALIAVQRRLIHARQQQVAHHLKDYLLGWHPASPIAWLAVPGHWTLPDLVQQLRRERIAVTSADPFTVPGSAAPHAIRIAIGEPCSQAQWQRALMTIAHTLTRRP